MQNYMRWIFLGGLFFSFFDVSIGNAEEGRIADLSVSFDQGEIFVYAQLVRGLGQKFEEDIHNGIPKDLFYYILLNRRQGFWVDEELLSQTIKHTIKFDILKKQYIVTTRVKGDLHEKIVSSFDEMRGLISEIKNVSMVSVSFLKSEETYYISVKAEIHATRLPFYFEYLLFFIPFLELDTPWANSSPFYAP